MMESIQICAVRRHIAVLCILMSVIVSKMIGQEKTAFSSGVGIDVRTRGAICDGRKDDYHALQQTIDDVAHVPGGGVVIVPAGATCATGSQLIIYPGVTLRGGTAVPYYCGLRYFAAEFEPTTGSRIAALNVFPEKQSLIKFESNAQGRTSAAGIFNLIIDAHKNATHGIEAVQVNQTEYRLTIAESCIQGARGDGLVMSNIVALHLESDVISANGGWGINLPYGTSDFQFTDLYVHTNQSGGIIIQDGSTYGRLSGGKIEDNYGPGLMLKTTSGTVDEQVNGVTFQHNNGPGIVAGGKFMALAVIDASLFVGNSSQSKMEDSAEIVAVDNGYLVITAPRFTGSQNLVIADPKKGNGKVVVRIPIAFQYNRDNAWRGNVDVRDVIGGGN